MSKITFRPERNFYGARQRAGLAAMNAAVEERMSEPFDKWFCNECGFVPLADIKRESEDSTTGVCKCGRKIDEIPF